MWTDLMKDIKRVGSRVTCDPAPTDTDEDYVVYTEDLSTLVGDCIEHSFTHEGSYAGSAFVSLRNGTTNNHHR